MPTSNELLFDALVRHQIFLLRFAGSVRNETMDLLNATERDLAMLVRDRLEKGSSARRLQKSVALIEAIKRIRQPMWKTVTKRWEQQFTDFLSSEVAFINGAVKGAAPVVLQTNLPSPGQITTLVKTSPFHGATLKGWADSVETADLKRIDQAIKIGIAQGEGSPTIARRIVGTARLKGGDGVTQITRANSQAIVRTAANHYGNQAREAFFQENIDLISKELFVATLDSRTTPVCRANDGGKFEVDKGPMPPLHINCRSLRVPVLNDEVLGERPAKPVTEKQLLREYADKLGFDKAPRTRAGLPRGHKTKFDQFQRKRVRQMVGTVPAKTTYQEWLKTQSAEFQDDVLGKTKGKLFRQGDLELKKFVNRQGDELTLKELAVKEADAFTAAGLKPEDFK